MGLLDFLLKLLSGEGQQCPSCGAPGATNAIDGTVRCKNPICPYFDASLGQRGTLRQAGSTVPTQGNYKPARPMRIRYRNFQGQERNFSADADSIVRKKNHIVARVAPTGKKIALSRERIQNLSEVESAFPQRFAAGQPWPTRVNDRSSGITKTWNKFSPVREDSRQVSQLVSELPLRACLSGSPENSVRLL